MMSNISSDMNKPCWKLAKACPQSQILFCSRENNLPTRKRVIRAEESFPISGQGYTVGKLTDKTNCNILIDTGMSQSYMSKLFYMQSKILHALPKFVPTTQRIQVGNGQYVAVLFVILVIIEIYGHLFEVFTLASEIHDNVDLVLGMKNAYELEGIVDM